MRLILIFLLSALTSTTFAQNDPWAGWSWMMGEWKGEASGRPGEGFGSFTLKADLDQKVLVRNAHNDYPAKELKKRIIHDDLMIIYEPGAKGNTAKAIYFDNEGHTINYSVEVSAKSIVFTSDPSPKMAFFRLTYTLLETERINTKFEISQDGKKYTTYVEGNSVRIN